MQNKWKLTKIVIKLRMRLRTQCDDAVRLQTAHDKVDQPQAEERTRR